MIAIVALEYTVHILVEMETVARDVIQVKVLVCITNIRGKCRCYYTKDTVIRLSYF